ncbi:MAG TPA: aminotransferase class I/II-fold pyridoxal phosphate-dependent enzyme, partial [Flavobacterium sp.]|nr:aminotransferase class I/II-fold pyridoxal phosphate-dependent enzyme [Flavobacterium sp.]
INLINDIPGMKVNFPEGAFYAFPDVSDYFGKTLRGKTINNADDLAMYLLEEANVATVTGDAFGAPNCIRMSYATSEELLTEAFRRIKEALV